MKKLLVVLLAVGFCGGAYADILWDQPWDGTSAGVVAQEFGDFPTYSSYEFDDFTVGAGGWSVNKVTIYGVEQGNGVNTDVRVAFSTAAAFPPTGTIYTGGTEVGSDLVINLPNVVVGAGNMWITGYVVRNFSPGGQWFWNRTLPVTGSEHYFHNPGGGFGYGTNPIPGTVLWGTPANLAFTIEGKVIPEPASFGLLAIGALLLRRR